MRITVTGDKELVRRLDAFNVKVQDVMDKALNDSLGDLVTTRLYGMENYVPKPPQSKYVRTGTLGAGWGLERPERNRFWIVNAVAYRKYVVGDRDKRGQAWMHRGRWWLARERIEEAIPDAIDKTAAAIRRFVERGAWD
jgi:hypothetical protein